MATQGLAHSRPLKDGGWCYLIGSSASQGLHTIPPHLPNTWATANQIPLLLTLPRRVSSMSFSEHMAPSGEGCFSSACKLVTCSEPSTPGLRPSLPPSPSPDIFHRCRQSLKTWLPVLTSSWALCDSSAHSEGPPTLSSSRPSCHGAFLGVSATPECITISQVTTTTTKSSQTRRIQSLMLRLDHSSLPE